MINFGSQEEYERCWPPRQQSPPPLIGVDPRPAAAAPAAPAPDDLRLRTSRGRTGRADARGRAIEELPRAAVR